MGRTTTRRGWSFHFGISEIGKLLGKSPVTLRGWESKGLVTFPRDGSGDRKVGSEGARYITEIARSRNRISAHRANLIHAFLTLVEVIESENNRKVKR